MATSDNRSRILADLKTTFESITTANGYKTDVEADRWYHVRLQFNCTTDTVAAWTDAVYEGTFAFRYPSSSISQLDFATSGSYSRQDYFAYLDDIAYSWNATYAACGVWNGTVCDLGNAHPYYDGVTLCVSTPPATQVAVSYRMSVDNNTWTAWSTWSTTNLTLQIYGQRYCQLRIQLTSSDPNETPTLWNVSLAIYQF